MKLQCIIISLAIVGFSAIDLNEFQKSIHLTNLIMLHAQVHRASLLRKVIRGIVDGNTPIDHIALLLAVPEFTFGQHWREVIVGHQATLRTAILQIFYFEISDDDANQVHPLEDLATRLRIITIDVLKAIINDILAESEQNKTTWMQLCRATALLSNIANPKSAVKRVEVDECGKCAIKYSNSTMNFDVNVANGDIIIEYISGL